MVPVETVLKAFAGTINAAQVRADAGMMGRTETRTGRSRGSGGRSARAGGIRRSTGERR
jgi:hypothetical protein